VVIYIIMAYEKKNVKLENELQASKAHLEKYTVPSSNIGADIIAEAMRKGKVNSDSHLYKDDDALGSSSHSLNNNSSHAMGVALGSSTHSHGTETDMSNMGGNGNTSRVLLGRYADQDKVSAKQRFTTESKDQFRLHRTSQRTRKLD
jgi:hypothetical protein